MTFVDTLTRLPSQAFIDLDLLVDGLHLSKDEIGFCQYDFISCTPKKQYQLREAIRTDFVLNSLVETITRAYKDGRTTPKHSRQTPDYTGLLETSLQSRMESS